MNTDVHIDTSLKSVVLQSGLLGQGSLEIGVLTSQQP